jgi:hypothetical protein
MATLPGYLAQDLADRAFKLRRSSETTNSTPASLEPLSASSKSVQLKALSRLASITASTWRCMSPLTPKAMSAVWLGITRPSIRKAVAAARSGHCASCQPEPGSAGVAAASVVARDLTHVYAVRPVRSKREYSLVECVVIRSTESG